MPPHHPHKLYIIRNPHTGWVFDASERHVKAQHYTGFPLQLWSLDHIDCGKFYIVNSQTRNVLGIEGLAKNEAKIITQPRNGSPSQQWHINSDGTIVNANGQNFAIDLISTQHLIVYQKHGKMNQQFVLQPK